MPMHTFRCTECQMEKDFYRSMADHGVPPTDDEFGDHSKSCPPDRRYEKVFRGAPTKVYGANWGHIRKGGYNSRG